MTQPLASPRAGRLPGPGALRFAWVRSLSWSLLLGIAACPVDAEALPSWTYDYGSEAVRLSLDPSRVALRVRGDLADPEPALRAAVAEESWADSTTEPTATDCARLWWLALPAGQTEAEILRLCERLRLRADLEFAAPVFRYGDAVLIPLPEILVEFDSTLDPATFSEALHADPELSRAGLAGVRLDRLRDFPSLHRTTLFGFHGAAASAFDLARAVARLPGVRAAQPNFLLQLTPFGVPDDPLFGSQWTLRNLGQNGIPGVDIEALAAWQWTTGSPDIVIALIDEGVDVDHPDLAPNLLPGHDSTDQPSPAGLAGNALDIDPHGTTCAGIAAAAGDNGLGVTGVSWRSSILPVRVGYASFWTQTSWVVDAITWSADHGADVLSSSWGGSPPSTLEQNAIAYAQTTGRGGLGCVVLFATGNSNSAVAYPAAYPEVIAVGATSPCDERKSFTSCDGQNWWGSNFGPEIDLVAPGPISWTTDLPGSLGFGPGDYVAFSGTSAACPHVAGAVALLLSLVPTLPATQVRALLEQTSDDLVGLPTEDTPGWDPHMGWGRLNAGALLAAAALAADPPVTQLVCFEVQSNVELSWAVPSPFAELRVHRDHTLIASLPGDAVSYIDVGAPPGRKTYRVQGLNTTSGAIPVACTVGVPFVRGDTNDSGGLNLQDVIVLLQHLFLTPGLTCLDAADVDDSGTLNLVDGVALLSYLFAAGPPPPAPFPTADTDPTPDALGCG
ncbi:MAG: S8 family serine peptidase [Planctomycetota bacterium]